VDALRLDMVQGEAGRPLGVRVKQWPSVFASHGPRSLCPLLTNIVAGFVVERPEPSR